MILINNTDPSPIPPRECACGCGYMFVPSRRDKKYLNKKHCDYAINSRRKKDSLNKRLINNKLDNNERLLMKFWKKRPEKEVIVPLFNLLTENFDPSVYIGAIEMKKKLYYKTYDYFFNIDELKGIRIIRILKQNNFNDEEF